MSFLGMVLNLDEGSRLTGTGIQPLARKILESDGRVYAHFIRMPHGGNASHAAGAVARFLTTAVACIDGNEPDGAAWFVVLQYAPVHWDPELAEEAADAGIARALALTGVSDEDVWSLVFTAEGFREIYAEAAAEEVDGWSVPDLLVGLLIQLTNADLAELVQSSSHPTLTGEDLIEHRHRQLDAALEGWTASFAGPEDGELL